MSMSRHEIFQSIARKYNKAAEAGRKLPEGRLVSCMESIYSKLRDNREGRYDDVTAKLLEVAEIEEGGWRELGLFKSHDPLSPPAESAGWAVGEVLVLHAAARQRCVAALADNAFRLARRRGYEISRDQLRDRAWMPTVSRLMDVLVEGGPAMSEAQVNAAMLDGDHFDQIAESMVDGIAFTRIVDDAREAVDPVHREAFERIALDWCDHLLYLARAIDPGHEEDIVNSTWLKLWVREGRQLAKHLDQLDHPRAFLMTAIRHAAIDCRAEHGRLVAVGDADLDTVGPRPRWDEGGFEASTDRMVLLSAIRGLVDDLSASAYELNRLAGRALLQVCTDPVSGDLTLPDDESLAHDLRETATGLGCTAADAKRVADRILLGLGERLKGYRDQETG